MSVTPDSTTPFGAAVAIPGDATVTFFAHDLGGGTNIVAVYSVLNLPSVQVSTATQQKAAAIASGPAQTKVEHTVHLERVPNTPAPSGTFFIEALVMENGQPVFPSTWTAQVAAGGIADKALALNVAEAATADSTEDPVDAAERGARIAKERAAALRAARRLFAKKKAGAKQGVKKDGKQRAEKAGKKPSKNR